MPTKQLKISHLFGTVAAYQMPGRYDSTKPTVVMINSFTMTSDLYKAQFKNEKLLDAVNILAIEPYGHGNTKGGRDTFTYWDTAIMAFQVLNALSIRGKVYALGTSQGGWIVARMALLDPDRIAGIIILGSSMDYESERSHKLGCMDLRSATTGPIKELQSTTPTPDFVISDEFRKLPIYVGFGENVDQATADFWHEELKKNYSGDAGRKRLKECCINLIDRDGLHNRLFEIQCPVLWLHGSKDACFSVANAEEEIKMFVNSPDAELKVIEGGAHYLSASNPEEVDKALMEFILKQSALNKKNAQALREAVGMVEM